MSCCGTTNTAQNWVEDVRKLKLEFLFLDDTVCQPCGGTARALEEAIDITEAPLAAMGVELLFEKIHVADMEAAKAHKLLTSPTIRINGNDIDPARTEAECGTCGDLAGGDTTVNCRNWHWRGEVYRAAPTGRIVEAIMDAATASQCCTGATDEAPYEIPENLEAFFSGREHGSKSCC